CRLFLFFFFSSRRRHTRFSRDWSSDVCSSDLRRLFSIYHFLVALIIVMLISPAFAGAEWDQRDTGTLTIHKLALEPGVEPGEREIGRASCRERVGNRVVWVAIETRRRMADH